MTVLESLKSISGYPVPDSTLTDIAVKRGLELTGETDAALLASAPFRLAQADILRWVSFAPSVSQGGISYSLSDLDKEQMRSEANAIYSELQDGSYKPKFGYKGDRL
jgi:hypothetical protein